MNLTLLILAAGMGSRYGGPKQLDKIGPNGETLLDFSIYDAIKAGVSKIIFIINENFEKKFKEIFIDKLKKKIDVDYIFQEIPTSRKKPWGTGHGIMIAENMIKNPFIVINSDDFYGRSAYQTVAVYYKIWDGKKSDYCMVGYPIDNTLSEYGPVSRGICQMDKDKNLINIIERIKIEKNSKRIIYKEGCEQSVIIKSGSLTSMNFWGFTPSIFDYLKENFKLFLQKNDDPNEEFRIPTVVNDLIKTKQIKIKVLPCNEKWFGMTYKEDRKIVVENIKNFVNEGVYC